MNLVYRSPFADEPVFLRLRREGAGRIDIPIAAAYFTYRGAPMECPIFQQAAA